MDEPPEWTAYNCHRENAYERAILQSELGFLYSKLGPEFQSAAIAKYKEAAFDLQWQCQALNDEAERSCELRVLHLFVCFGYALCAHRNADLHVPRAQLSGAELRDVFAHFTHCMRELFANYAAAEPFGCRAFLLLAQCYASHWKLYRHLTAIALSADNAGTESEQLIFTISFEELQTINKELATVSYAEFAKRFQCANPACIKIKKASAPLVIHSHNHNEAAPM